MDLKEKYKEKDDEQADVAHSDGSKYRRLFTPQVDEKQRGTEYELENLACHIQLGCNDYPLPMEEMYVPARPDVPTKGSKLMPLMSLQGSSCCKSTNWQIGLTVITASRLSASMTHMQCDKCLFIFNIDKDATTAHITGKKPNPIDWFLEESLLNDGGHVFVRPQCNPD